VEAAIEFEIKRHAAALDAGEELAQETRGWDENSSKTFSQRSKETAKDYRYFPDPDIPKIKTSEITEYSKSVLTEKLPVLPNEKRIKYKSYGLAEQMIETVISDSEIDSFFAAVVELLADADKKLIVLAANYTSVDLKTADLFGSVEPSVFVDLLTLLHSGDIGSRGAKDLLPKLAQYSGSVRKLAESEGAIQNSDPAALSILITSIVSNNQEQVAEFKSGKETVLKYLVGQGMKLSKGAANPAILEELLKTEINK
jgi:aspartyl-tRNA(Asn)/glutamyl-tRNA(Gln) amidotransferase subunit B